MDWLLAWTYAGTAWFVQLCMLLEIHCLLGKNSEYLLCMTIRGEQREDVDVKRVVRAFRNEFWKMMAVLFAAVVGFFPISLLPTGSGSAQLFYLLAWTTALIVMDYKVINKYTNRMYELKISKGWGTLPKQSTMEVDTVVSRMKKSMPVSEIWLAVPVWICIGSFMWWFYFATEYKMLLITLITNVAVLAFFCYMYHRMAHGRLKVYSEDSEINYALNKAAKRAWTGCIVWEAVLICGYHFIVTLLLHSYMKDVAAGAESMTGFWVGFTISTIGTLFLVFAVFFGAAGRVKQAKKELATAANFSYAEDEDMYWRNGYYYNPNDPNAFVESRTYGLATNMATKWGPITKWLLLGTLIFCIVLGIAMLPLDFGTVTMEIGTKGVELQGGLYYHETLSFADVTKVHLLTERPESSRVWGTGTKRFSFGDYCFDDYGNGKAMMDKEAEYFLMVKRQNGKWFGFSVKDSKKMQECYSLLKEYADMAE